MAIASSTVCGQGCRCNILISLQPFSSNLNLFSGIFKLRFLSFVAINSQLARGVFFLLRRVDRGGPMPILPIESVGGRVNFYLSARHFIAGWRAIEFFIYLGFS